VIDFLENHHMFSVTDVLTSIEAQEIDTDASVYDVYEQDDFGISHLLVESKLGEPLREKIRIRYDHLTNFYDLPGPAICNMAMDICNASKSFDIEGAQERFDDLKLEDFQGEDVTACTAAAQKYIKILQSGYAPPYRTGLKLIKKLTVSSCQEFNRKAFAQPDLVKRMEGAYKLADPKRITQDTDHATLGPIGIMAWAQKEHTQLVTDHEWPAMASKLPESNLAETNLAKSSYASKVKDGFERTCYQCGSKDHLRPECTQPPKEGERSGGPPPTTKPEEQRVRKALASWKYIQPRDITKTYTNNDKKEWTFCTKCTCKATSKKGFFQLSHFDADHQDGFRPHKTCLTWIMVYLQDHHLSQQRNQTRRRWMRTRSYLRNLPGVALFQTHLAVRKRVLFQTHLTVRQISPPGVVLLTKMKSQPYLRTPPGVASFRTHLTVRQRSLAYLSL
jgi:hypothetical protein